MIKIYFNKSEKEKIANILIDNIIIGRLSNIEKETAWDIAKKVLENQEDMLYLKKHEIQLICNSLIRYKNRYVYEKEFGNKSFSVYNYIISCCRKEI